MAYPPAPAQQVKAWLDAGLAAHHQGDLPRAIAAYRHVLTMAPEHGPALNLLGTGLLQLGEAGEAVQHLEHAVRRQRNEPNLLANLAQAYLALERYPQAADTFRKAIRLAPGEAHFHVGAAAALAMQGRLGEAQALLQRLTSRFPASALVWFNLGNVERDRGEPDAAIAAYEKALALDPSHADARSSLGSVLHSREQFAEAETHYRACLQSHPQHALARYNLASLLIDVGRFAEAEGLCREIVAIDDRFADGHAFLGAALGHQGRLVEALACHERASALAPGNTRYAAALGTALTEIGRIPEGLRRLADALDAEPENDTLRQSLFTALLANGRMQDGWSAYARRPAAVRLREKNEAIALAEALPAPLEGRHVCVIREQGIGDEIFLLRWARKLAGRGARVSYRANSKIVSVLARAPFINEVLDESAPLPQADAYLLVGDLPNALGALPTSSVPKRDRPRRRLFPDLPEHISVFWPPVPETIAIAPLEASVAALRQRLSDLGPPPYVGVTWRAGTRPEAQNAGSWMLYKEVPPHALATALKTIDGTFLALQRNPGAGEIDIFAAALDRPLHDFTALNDDLENMLALLALIDEYVGVSNTNMHLRAAAGRTARVLVPAPAEWRWLQSARASPWFPGFSVYRQSVHGSWTAALTDLRRDLGARSA